MDVRQKQLLFKILPRLLGVACGWFLPTSSQSLNVSLDKNLRRAATEVEESTANRLRSKETLNNSLDARAKQLSFKILCGKMWLARTRFRPASTRSLNVSLDKNPRRAANRLRSKETLNNSLDARAKQRLCLPRPLLNSKLTSGGFAPRQLGRCVLSGKI